MTYIHANGICIFFRSFAVWFGFRICRCIGGDGQHGSVCVLICAGITIRVGGHGDGGVSGGGGGGGFSRHRGDE